MAADFDRASSSAAPPASTSAGLPTSPVSLTSPTAPTPAIDSLPDLLKPNLTPFTGSPKFSFPLSPAALTGAAALADERRTRESSRGQSPNPAATAIAALLGSQGGMSTPKDASSATTAVNTAVADAASSMNIDSLKGQHSTNSADRKAATATAIDSGTGPSKFSVAGEASTAPHDPSSTPDMSSRAFSLPGAVIAAGESLSSPVRGSSLPGSSWGPFDSPRSGSRGDGQHRCHHCNQTFTRPHNLKSHLLTHSQEKPYSCEQCPLKFRRLHDLKRHMKLHTGERPHICDKCGRKFARGDALNRHAKGQGGCAGRRASMDGLGSDDEFRRATGTNDEIMQGLIYTEQTSSEFDRMEDETDRRLSLPAPKAANLHAEHLARQATSYPPVSGSDLGANSRSLYPPPRGSNSTENTSHRTAPTSLSSGGSAAASMFSGANVTESPKPLSPSAVMSHGLSDNGRRKSPSLSQQLGAQYFGRRGSRGTPPVDLPPIAGSGSHPSLPPIDKYQSTHLQNSMPAPAQNGAADSANMFTSVEGMYSYMHSYMRQMEDKVNRLQDEVNSLKGQLASLAPGISGESR